MTRDEMRLRLIASVAPHFISEREGMNWVSERQRIERAAELSVDFADAVLRCIDAREAQISDGLRDAVGRLKAAGARLEAENGGGQ